MLHDDLDSCWLGRIEVTSKGHAFIPVTELLTQRAKFFSCYNALLFGFRVFECDVALSFSIILIVVGPCHRRSDSLSSFRKSS